MPNEQITVPLFTAGEVLTAANMNISAGTGVPVFLNTTTRDAGFGGAGEKVLAEGQLCYLSSTNVVQYYDGADWATVGPAAAPTSGLTLIKTQTIGTTVSTVTVTGAFSTTYDAYKIVISGGTCSQNNDNFNMQLGSTTSGYYFGAAGTTYATNTVALASGDNTSSWQIGFTQTDGLNCNIDLVNPFLASRTFLQGSMIASVNARSVNGVLQNATSYTAFTLTDVGGGTMTGGTIRVYGYANS
jgi:hypothetical protein